MAKYVFDDIVVPSGILKITLINNAVDANTYYLNGDYILNIAKLNEVVEDNGVGGILKISDMDLELYDKDNRLKNEVFLKGTITEAQAKILLTVSGTDYTVLYGDVDLSTIEYPSYYDDEDTKESRSCKFVVFSFLKRLEQRTLTDLRNALTPDAVSYTALGSIDSGTYLNPAAMSSDASQPTSGIAWTGALFGSQSDDLRATSALTYNQFTKYLKATTFVNEYGSAINIDASQTIDGIEFQFETSKSVTSFGTIKDYEVRIIKGGAVQTAVNRANGTYLTTTDTFITYGNDSDLWGITLTPADVNSSSFGAAISFLCDSLGFAATAQVDSVKCIITSHDTDSATEYVLVSKVIDRIQDELDLTTMASSGVIEQLFQGHTTQTNYYGLYFPYKLSSGEYANIWNETKTGSFMTLKDCKSLLILIAGHFLAYPVLRYTIGTNSFSIQLKQRSAGTVFTKSQLGILKKSTNRNFYGYDAIRVKSAVRVNPLKFKVSPAQMTEEQFELVVQKFDYPMYWGNNGGEALTVEDSGFGNAGNRLYLLISGANMRAVTKIIDGATTYSASWARWLLARFIQYWSTPDMYERTYKGTGIGGANPIEILDRLTIGSTNYTLTEITRDFIENEMSVKAVEY